jgi:hypothetical protein
MKRCIKSGSLVKQVVVFLLKNTVNNESARPIALWSKSVGAIEASGFYCVCTRVSRYDRKGRGNDCLVHILGLSVVAEGAETEEEYNAVRDVGCNLIQGFYFGKPAMATDIWSGFVKVGAL